MTERLNQLLHDEADRLDIPPVAAGEVLGRGRVLRRRRTFAKAGAAAAVLAVVGGITVAVTNGGDNDRAIEPAAPTANVPAFGFESTIYVGELTASVPETTHSLYYTSEGVLVRSNPNEGGSDGSGPESLTLVRYDGSTTDLGDIPEGVGPATDPEKSVYVLARPVATASWPWSARPAPVRPSTRCRCPTSPRATGRCPRSLWTAATLSLGYKCSRSRPSTVATGKHQVVRGQPRDSRRAGGRIFVGKGTTISVLDAGTGEVVLTVRRQAMTSSRQLSPDGSTWCVIRRSTTRRSRTRSRPTTSTRASPRALRSTAAEQLELDGRRWRLRRRQGRLVDVDHRHGRVQPA